MPNYAPNIPIETQAGSGLSGYGANGLASAMSSIGSGIEEVGSAFGSASQREGQLQYEGAKLNYQMAKDAYEVGQAREKQAAKSDTAASIFNVMQQTNNAAYGMPTEVSSAVSDAGDQLNKVQSAQNQGKVPLGSLDIQLENTMGALISKHPEYADQIMSQLKDMGYDHYMFRNVQARQASVAAMQQTQNDVQSEFYKTGLELGATGTPEQISMAGAAHIKAKMALDTAQTMKATDDASMAIKGQQVTSAMLDVIASTAGGATDKFISQLSQAAQAGDAQWAEAVKTAGPQLNNTIQSVRTNVHNYMARQGITDTKAIDNYLDQMQGSLEAALAGKASDFQQTARDVQTLQNKLTLNSAKAYPLATQLKNAFGSGWMQTMNPILSNPQMAKQLSDELNNVDASKALMSTSQGRQVINTVADAVNGRLGPIQSIPPSQVDAVMKGISGALNYSTGALANKTDTSMQTQNVWRNSYGKTMEALQSLVANPNNKNINPNSLATASQMLFNGSTRAVLADHLAQQGDSREQGEALLMHSRTTAVATLDALRSQDLGKYQLTYNPKSGQYVVTEGGRPAQAPAGNQVLSGVGFGGPITTSYGSGANGAQAFNTAQTVAQTANRVLDHLQLTDKYDQQLPKGATPLSERAFWASGGDPAKLINARGQQIVKPQQEQQKADPVKAIQDFSSALTGVTSNMDSIVNNAGNAGVSYPQGQEIYDPYINRAAAREGVPQGILNRMINQESGYNPSAKNPGSSATGIAQFIKRTAKTYGLDPNDPYSSIDAAAQYLAQLHKKTGSWESALDAYGTTARSNFKTDQDQIATRRKILGQ